MEAQKKYEEMKKFIDRRRNAREARGIHVYEQDSETFEVFLMGKYEDGSCVSEVSVGLAHVPGRTRPTPHWKLHDTHNNLSLKKVETISTLKGEGVPKDCVVLQYSGYGARPAPSSDISRISPDVPAYPGRYAWPRQAYRQWAAHTVYDIYEVTVA